MEKRNRKGRVLCLLVLCLVMLAGNAAFAADSVSVSIPVKQAFTTSKEIPEDLDREGRYELTAKTSDCPMPKGTENGSYTFTLTGDEEAQIGEITYLHGGIYSYELRQVTEDKDRYTYDRTVYQIDVCVKNEADGSLSTQIIAANESGEKVSEIAYYNSYEGVEPPEEVTDTPEEKEPEKTGNVKTGDSANLMLWGGAALLAAVLVFIGAAKRKHEADEDK